MLTFIGFDCHDQRFGLGGETLKSFVFSFIGQAHALDGQSAQHDSEQQKADSSRPLCLCEQQENGGEDCADGEEHEPSLEHVNKNPRSLAADSGRIGRAHERWQGKHQENAGCAGKGPAQVSPTEQAVFRHGGLAVGVQGGDAG